MTDVVEKIVILILGAVFGAVVNHYRETKARERERQRRLSALWAALEAEITMCGTQARKFLGIIEDEDKFFLKHREDHLRVKTPDYRLPSLAYRSALPALIAEGAVDRKAIEPLFHFYNGVERINRGFDNAADLRLSEVQGRPSGWEFGDQLRCNVRYALNLTPQSKLPPMPTGPTRLPAAVRGYWKKAVQAQSSLFDKAMDAIEAHRQDSTARTRLAWLRSLQRRSRIAGPSGRDTAAGWDGEGVEGKL